jgi:hypothetical protein
MVEVEQALKQHAQPHTLFVDACHYSAEGHRVAGKFLAEFLMAHIEGRRPDTRP